MNNILSWQSVRFNDISILRVSAMLMVVLYHCLCPYSIWDHTDYYIGFHVYAWDVVDGMLAQIHLPIFFIISGYLYGYKRFRGGGILMHVFLSTIKANECFCPTLLWDCSCVYFNKET